MSNGLFDFSRQGGGLYALAQTKRKIFVSYHHGGDRPFYELFSRTFCDQYDVIDDNSPERAIDSDNVAHSVGRDCLSDASAGRAAVRDAAARADDGRHHREGERSSDHRVEA